MPIMKLSQLVNSTSHVKTAEYFAEKNVGFGLKIYLFGEPRAGGYRAIAVGEYDLQPDLARRLATALNELADLAESGEDLPVIEVSK
jgi:hypothetical protein